MTSPSKLGEPEIIDIFTVQLTVLSCAVESLIATHPEPEKVKTIFDQLFGQILAGVLASGGAKPAGAELAKQYAEKLFARP